MNRFEEAAQADDVLVNVDRASADWTKAVADLKDIKDRIVYAYDESGAVDGKPIATGLLYGRIQSGKTRTMVLTSALAMDDKFKVIIVLTSNNNDLVQQTYDDFKSGLPGVKVISKAELMNDMRSEVDLLNAVLPTPQGSVVIVCSKGPTVLKNVIDFLNQINASAYPTIIFDDEGDQATLDTTTRQRSLGREMASSSIFSLIHSSDFASLRRAVPNSIFISVTGTPQALFLQNSTSESRPSFIKLIEPGKGYVGGDVFFENPDPEANKYVSLVEEDEADILLDETAGIPDGLRDAIDFFILAATLAGMEKGWKEYNMLAHPSLNRFDHALVQHKITDHINQLIRTLTDPQSAEYPEKIKRFERVYNEIISRRRTDNAPSFEDVIDTLKLTLPQRQIFVINSDRRGPIQSPSKSYNFLIGGNSIGRGIAVKRLLVTYYTRNPRIARMDTMHQHARMFGYRQDWLKYTKLFLPMDLYTRFYGIHASDSAMRDFLRTRGDDISTMLVPTNTSYGLAPTRNDVIDMANVDIILPGSQIYPDRPVFEKPLAMTIRKKVMKILEDNIPHFDPSDKAEEVVGSNVAVKLVESIKTRSSTSWQDKHIKNYLMFLKEQYGDKVCLKFRVAPNRTNRYGGVLASGMISGAEQAEARKLDMPTLWIFLVKGSREALKWDGVDFVYPTLIVPNKNESLFGNVS